jgi:hypothetical protein
MRGLQHSARQDGQPRQKDLPHATETTPTELAETNREDVITTMFSRMPQDGARVDFQGRGIGSRDNRNTRPASRRRGGRY